MLVLCPIVDGDVRAQTGRGKKEFQRTVGRLAKRTRPGEKAVGGKSKTKLVSDVIAGITYTLPNKFILKP